MISTRDGSELLFAVQGQSVQERAVDDRRAILARVELTTEAEPYRWLNTCFLVGEGEIDERREVWWLDSYVCVNERAQGPPAFGCGTAGAFPPARPLAEHGVDQLRIVDVGFGIPTRR
jgi:hypothetical protein